MPFPKDLRQFTNSHFELADQIFLNQDTKWSSGKMHLFEEAALVQLSGETVGLGRQQQVCVP